MELLATQSVIFDNRSKFQTPTIRTKQSSFLNRFTQLDWPNWQTRVFEMDISNAREIPQGIVFAGHVIQPNPEEVLVVIPALNEATNIETCIRSLVEDGDPFMRFVRIVVADGGSSDGTQEIVHRLSRKFPRLSLIANAARLQSSGVNLAVEAETGAGFRFLVRCDAHSTYPSGYVRRIVETLVEKPEAASVATVMVAVGRNPFQQACAWVIDTPLGSGGSAHRGGNWSGWVDHGHHAGFRLDWFRRIDGYDPSFSHNEDAEYDHRLGLAGGRVWLESDIRLEYHVRPTPRGLMRQYWNYGRGRARTVLKHRMRPRLRQLVPVINLCLVLLCFALAPLWPWLLLLPLHYLLTLMTVAGVCAHSLHRISGLYAGLALAIIHNAWALGFLWELMTRGVPSVWPGVKRPAQG